jgi:hypothetical protein
MVLLHLFIVVTLEKKYYFEQPRASRWQNNKLTTKHVYLIEIIK